MGRLIHRIKVFFMLLLIVMFLAGTRACQENYDFASQTGGIDTPTPTPTDDDDDDIIPVPTPNGTPVATPTAAPAPTPILDDDDDLLDDDEPGLLESLAALDEGEKSALSTNIGAAGDSFSSQSGGSNWLGQAFSDKDPIETEEAYLFLQEMMQGFDDDLDGIPNAYEVLLGTNPFEHDTSRNGYSDAVELLFGSDPLNPHLKPDMSTVEAHEIFMAISPYKALISSLVSSPSPE